MSKVVLLSLLVVQIGFSQTSPHGSIKIECASCHTTDSWKLREDRTFDHSTTGFALAGQHSSVKCNACHRELKFEAIDATCTSCHLDAHKSDLGTNCLRCHTQKSWQIPDMIQKHQQTRFTLLGRHATATCQSCHQTAADHLYSGTPTDCIGCHRSDYLAASTPNHMSAGFSTQCNDCHSASDPVWGSRFDHSQTAFPLQGAHTAVACISCHSNRVFAGLSGQCISCHRDNYNATQSPSHVALNYSTDCLTCHTPNAWQPSTFNHSTTSFPLTGAHQAVTCGQCHVNNQYQNLPLLCYDCHVADFTGAQQPNHLSANFNHDCTQCHTTATWAGATFDHNTTNFPLTGAHTPQQCQSCHVNGNYQLVYAECYQCHQTQFAQPVNPNHVVGNFNHDCTTCHTTTAWNPSTFSHNSTPFPLTGAHQAVTCSECHVNNVYQGLPSDCFDCHATAYNGTINPNHQALGIPHDCTMCHSNIAWSPASFNHSTTNFPLTGAHTTAQCQSCHVNGNYQLVYVDCYQCHQTQFAQPVNPNHVAGNFNHDCTPCHTTTAWNPSTFSHNSTPFPLTGAHQAVTCAQCHVNNVYQGLPSDCYDCHATAYNGTTNPNHQALGIPHDCTMCHSNIAWSPASFNHSTTNFPLTGAHTTAQCQSCHVNGNYQLVYVDCYQCHQTQFAQPTNPNHVAGNFNHDCTPCHTTAAWIPSTFSHNSTPFPLTGAHQAVMCSECHVNNVYQGLPSDCYDCHATAYNGTTNPNHQSLNFPHECTQCHTTAAWNPASFNHTATNFPLTGAHTSTPCLSCHVNGNYQLVYVDCYQCHQTQFAQPTDPNHVAGNFNHDCTPCHTTTAWSPSTFSHNSTPFPLTGAHQAVTCSQCHVNNVYQGLPSDCYDCHATAYNGTTNPNHQSLNFPHECTQCHTTAAWSPASFNHTTTNFPLTGAHTTTPCISCHVNGNYQLVYVDCYQCHQAQFAQPTNPNHVTLQFSHDCTPCHTTTAWLPSTFNHDVQYFKIYSGRHRNRWTSCSQCHPSIGNYSVFTCTTACHPQNEMNDQHHDVTGYIYSSPACYSCHRNV